MRRSGWIGPIEWAAARRPVPGEEVCGDFPIAVDVGGTAALFGVADGLGHGRAAETAALRADGGRKPLPRRAPRRAAAAVPSRPGRHQGGRNHIGPHRLRNRHAELDRNRQRHRRPCRQEPWRCPDPGVCPAGRRHRGLPHPARAGHTSGFDRSRATCSSSRPTASSKTTLDGIDFAAPAMAIAEHILNAYGRESDDALVLAARHRGASS